MKISTKGRYALSFMLDLLTNENETPISIKDIAQRQEVSEKYLEQIAGNLLRNGLIQSVRGSSGGYMLRRQGKDYCQTANYNRVQQQIKIPSDTYQTARSCL